MSKCSDFTSHKSDIEELVNEVSCNHLYTSVTLFTPKFHCKLAGDGIEYPWGGKQTDLSAAAYPLKM